MNSTLAPSEKHLEDWICTNFNQFGEQVPETYWDAAGYLRNTGVMGVSPFFWDLVEKQYSLPSGRPDLICWKCGSITAVELKKGAITYDVVGQCLRYIYDLKEIFSWVFARYTDFNDDSNPYNYRHIGCIEASEFPDSEVTGMVVGSHIADRNIPLVCATGNIKVVTYEFENGGYNFTHHGIERKALINYRNQIDSRIGEFICSAMLWRAREQQEEQK